MSWLEASDRDCLVLVLMPTARDAERTRQLLTSERLSCHVCHSWEEMCEEVRQGAGIAMFAEESLKREGEQTLENILKSQPAWSDFPLVVLSREEDSLRGRQFLQKVNALLVERPVKKRSLLSSVYAALRARQHQYAVRRHLEDQETQARILSENEARLSFALSAGRLGSWELDLATHTLTSSPACRAIFGQRHQPNFTYQGLVNTIHPDDAERVQQACPDSARTHEDYDVECRIRWPDDTLHWILMRGQHSYDSAGNAIRLTGVVLDITEQKKLEADLRDIDRRKDEFLAMLAHELRNPLAPVRAGLELLALEGADPESIGVMRNQVTHLVHMVDDLLDVSRITRGKIQLRKEPVDVNAIIARACDAIQPIFTSHSHSLTVDCATGPIWVDADPVRLTQVLMNLLNNAAKYTPDGGRISLTMRASEENVTFTVHDNGIGMEPDLLNQVFELFIQADRSLERSEGGLGIGLTLVRTLIEFHGGSVEAHSSGIDQGSEFIVTIPRLQNHRPQLPPSAPLLTGERRRILIVEDNVGTAIIQAKLLAKLGDHIVRTANDGISAIETALEMKPDIILLDIGLPRMNGFEVAARLREFPQFTNTLLVALTGYGTDEDRRRSSEAGFDLHFVKPPSIDTLRLIIQHSQLNQQTSAAASSQRDNTQEAIGNN